MGMGGWRRGRGEVEVSKVRGWEMTRGCGLPGVAPVG
jgi:hypothetical protein